MTEDTDLMKAADLLLASISDDNTRHGGLLSRETVRRGDEMRIILHRLRKAPKADPV